MRCIGLRQGGGGWALQPRFGPAGPHLGQGGPAGSEARSADDGGEEEGVGAAATVALPVAARRRASRTHFGSGRTLLGLVCPRGGFTGPLGPAGPDGDWCALLPRPVDYRLGGGGCSLPRGRGSARPGSLFSSPPSCRPRGGYFGETTMVASSSFWRMVVGG